MELMPRYNCSKTRFEDLAVVVIIVTAVLHSCTVEASLELNHRRLEFDKYHNYDEMTDYLTGITEKFPNISSLYSIGKSVLKRQLWVVKLTTATELLGVPNIKIIGNIHGNEPVGREIILHLIQYLLDNRLKNKEINKLLQTTVIHLLPSMNPDGFEMSKPHVCPNDDILSPGTRGNANTVDLNRNFPDKFNPHTRPLQPETKAIMDWMKSVPFVMSLGLHGGALVANYPYDDSADSISSVDAKIDESLTPDDDVFRFLAKLYARIHPAMHVGKSCADEVRFKDGVTNGALWYQIIGSMQDYNYAWHGCMEITLEMSCCKYPPASFLESHWNDNLKSLLSWMQQAHRGIKGIVTSQATGKPIPNAIISISGRENSLNTTDNGEYWKILLPGVYKMIVNAAGHDELVIRIEVPEQEDPAGGPRPLLVNVMMEPTAMADSTVSVGHYTYRVLNGNRVSAMEAVTKTTTVVLREPPTIEPEENDYRDRLYVLVTNDKDDVDLQLMRPPMPVSSFSAATATPTIVASDNRFCYHVTKVVTLFLGLYYVSVYSCH